MVAMESHRQPRFARILSDIVDQVSPVTVIDFKKYGVTLNVKSLLLFQENQGAPFRDVMAAMQKKINFTAMNLI